MTRGGGGGGDGKGPLFPRLHVSDAGKGGGPRAPPRNKMALYEQLTVPSNRFSSPAPAPARAAGAKASLVPSTSAAQVRRSLFALLSGSSFPSPETQNSVQPPVLTVFFAAEFSPCQTRQTSVLAFFFFCEANCACICVLPIFLLLSKLFLCFSCFLATTVLLPNIEN